MRILAVGGGSGGHVTPVLAVINELAKDTSNLKVFFICDRRFGPQAELLMSKSTVPVTTRRIFAGKLRRYYGVSLLRQLLDIPTTLLNIRDIFLVLLGVMQSIYYVWRWQPDVVFTKGGFVCLPVGIVAHLRRIPIVTHDSDMRPGLTNRILSKWAEVVATGMPLENYSYDRSRAFYVGVPIDPSFRPFTTEEQKAAKHGFGFVDINRPLIAVTGGGQGARRINNAVVAIAEQLAESANIIHITGAKQYDSVKQKAPEIHGYTIVPFVHDGMAKVMGAADIIVTRASATTLLEIAGLAKPAIAIPSAVLGDQVKNARAYADMQAVVLVEEPQLNKDPQLLLRQIQSLLNDDGKRRELAKSIHSLAKPQAAKDVAQLIKTTAAKHKPRYPVGP